MMPLEGCGGQPIPFFYTISARGYFYDIEYFWWQIDKAFCEALGFTISL
jgi:hypothetical protein